jgi:hypothetical protein
MQVSDSTNLGLEYPLALNPNGGFVGIGTTSPTSRLELAANGGSSMITLKRTNASNGGAKGGIRFTENTNGYNVGTIACLGDGANTSGALCFYTKASSTDAGVYLPTTDERMRITSTGNVGIGTSNPLSTLEVGDGTYPNTGDATGSISLHGTGATKSNGDRPGLYHRSGVGLGLWSDAHMTFEVNGANGNQTEAMRILTSGNVGVGTASPGEKLHVHENLSTSGHQICARIGGTASSTYSTLVFGSKDGRPHIGGHKGDYGAWHDLSFQNDLMVLKQSNMRVGINTSSPDYPLDVSFAGDSGAAIRSTTSHTSLNFFPASGYSYLRFNESNGTASVWLQALAGGHLAIRPQAGNETIRFTSGGDINCNYGKINFGTRTTQHLNLWGTDYGIGIQSNTLYFRSYDHFAFHENGTHSDTALDPGSGGALRMVIRGGGNVGIGTSSPLGRLHVSDGNGPTNTNPSHTPPLYVTGNINGQSGGSEFRHFNQSQGIGIAYASVYATGYNSNQEINIISRGTSSTYIKNYAVYSDDRLKTNEEYITNATDTLMKLKPQIYDKHEEINVILDNPIREAGLMAQDIYYDAPELRYLVSARNKGIDAESVNIPQERPFIDDDPTNDPDYSEWGTASAGVAYIQLIPYLIKSNQELKLKNDALEARIAALENA